jgi:hypothetical protein
VNVFFDIDNTIVGGIDGSLRPGTREVFEQLVDRGHDIYVWSGMGVRPAEVRKAGLEAFVKGVYQKPMSHYEEGLVRYGVPVMPDFIIDDHPEIVEHFGGHCIAVYLRRGPGYYGDADKELYVVPGLIDAHLALSAAAPAANEHVEQRSATD